MSKGAKFTKESRSVMAKQNAGITNHKGETSGVFLCKRHPDCVRAVLTPNRIKKRQNGRRVKEESEPSFTLTCQDQHGVLFGCFGEEKRGRVGKQCAHAVLTNGNMGVLLCCRIRRLTPRECWRLQSFDDYLFDRARTAGVSDTQLYKQAGNAVTVNIVYEIGKRLAKMEKEEGGENEV